MPETPDIARYDSVLVAANKLLCREIHNINLCVQGVFDRKDTNPLHDLRISIRKLRAALRLFQPFLQDTSAAALDSQFARLCDDLGPARDYDAWLEYLQSDNIRQQFAGDAGYESYVARLMQQRVERLPQLCFLLESSYNAAFRQQVQEFTEQQLAALLVTDSSPPIADFTGPRVYRHYRKVIKLEEVDPTDPAEQVHQLRKKCRRGRYWTEFTSAVNGPATARLTKYFRNIATSLGTARDMHLHVEQLHNNELELPADLVKWHQRMERKAWKKYARTWRKMTEKSFQRQLKKELLGRRKHHD